MNCIYIGQNIINYSFRFRQRRKEIANNTFVDTFVDTPSSKTKTDSSFVPKEKKDVLLVDRTVKSFNNVKDKNLKKKIDKVYDDDESDKENGTNQCTEILNSNQMILMILHCLIFS